MAKTGAELQAACKAACKGKGLTAAMATIAGEVIPRFREIFRVSVYPAMEGLTVSYFTVELTPDGKEDYKQDGESGDFQIAIAPRQVAWEIYSSHCMNPGDGSNLYSHDNHGFFHSRQAAEEHARVIFSLTVREDENLEWSVVPDEDGNGSSLVYKDNRGCDRAAYHIRPVRID